MTPREKILKAFEPGGTPQIGAVSCYDGIFIRDHWFELTEVPWWMAGSGIVEQELEWMRDVLDRSGLEWLGQGRCASRAGRRAQRIERRDDEVWRVDTRTGEKRRLSKPTRSGTDLSSAKDVHFDLDMLPSTPDQIDALIPDRPPVDVAAFRSEGSNDVALAAKERLGILTYGASGSPLSLLHGVLSYEGMMILLATRPDLAVHAGRRFLKNNVTRLHEQAELGIDAIWIEELFTDQISPELFRDINLPLLQESTAAIRRFGLKSIYYFCGDPNGRLDLILQAGADAVHFEESKKGFTIDIEDVVALVDGRCTVFGNLDSIGVLQDGSEQALEAEVRRQLDAGRRNRGRFVMSTGSPITPDTPVERVKLYTDLVREMQQ